MLCDHPLLIKQCANAAMTKTLELKDLVKTYLGTDTSSFADNFAKDLLTGDSKECPVCLEDIIGGILLPACLHVVCEQCVEDILLKAQEKNVNGQW